MVRPRVQKRREKIHDLRKKRKVVGEKARKSAKSGEGLGTEGTKDKYVFGPAQTPTTSIAKQYGKNVKSSNAALRGKGTDIEVGTVKGEPGKDRDPGKKGKGDKKPPRYDTKQGPKLERIEDRIAKLKKKNKRDRKGR